MGCSARTGEAAISGIASEHEDETIEVSASPVRRRGVLAPVVAGAIVGLVLGAVSLAVWRIVEDAEASATAQILVVDSQSGGGDMDALAARITGDEFLSLIGAQFPDAAGLNRTFSVRRSRAPAPVLEITATRENGAEAAELATAAAVLAVELEREERSARLTHRVALLREVTEQIAEPAPQTLSELVIAETELATLQGDVMFLRRGRPPSGERPVAAMVGMVGTAIAIGAVTGFLLGRFRSRPAQGDPRV